MDMNSCLPDDSMRTACTVHMWLSLLLLLFIKSGACGTLSGKCTGRQSYNSIFITAQYYNGTTKGHQGVIFKDFLGFVQLGKAFEKCGPTYGITCGLNFKKCLVRSVHSSP